MKPMRLVLLIPVLAAALQADPITVIQTSSTVGHPESSYSYDVPTSAGAVTANVNSSVDCHFIPPCGNNLAFAKIDLTLDLFTSGPPRDGTAFISLFFDSDGGAGGGGNAGGSIGPYTFFYDGTHDPFCPNGISCGLAGNFPFQLGVPFSINLHAMSSAGGQLGNGGSLGGASVQLHELTGAPVQIYLATPEPSGLALAVTGLCALILFAAIRRRRAVPTARL